MVALDVSTFNISSSANINILFFVNVKPPPGFSGVLKGRKDGPADGRDDT